MGIIRAQVRFQRTTLLPEDLVINTFHFTCAGTTPTAPELAEVQTALEQFYNVAAAPSTANLAGHMSKALHTTDHRLKIYALADPEPRVPRLDAPFTLAAHGNEPIPSEVAICMSFKSEQVSGTNPRRSRGRVYLGPFGTTVMTLHTSGDTRVHATVQNIIANAGKRLADFDFTTDMWWGVWSEPDLFMRKVKTIWVDDAFDIQRRRGARPIARVQTVAT